MLSTAIVGLRHAIVNFRPWTADRTNMFILDRGPHVRAQADPDDLLKPWEKAWRVGFLYLCSPMHWRGVAVRAVRGVLWHAITVSRDVITLIERFRQPSMV